MLIATAGLDQGSSHAGGAATTRHESTLAVLARDSAVSQALGGGDPAAGTISGEGGERDEGGGRGGAGATVFLPTPPKTRPPLPLNRAVFGGAGQRRRFKHSQQNLICGFDVDGSDWIGPQAITEPAEPVEPTESAETEELDGSGIDSLHIDAVARGNSWRADLRVTGGVATVALATPEIRRLAQAELIASWWVLAKRERRAAGVDNLWAVPIRRERPRRWAHT